MLPVFFERFYQRCGIGVGAMALDWHTIFINDKFCEVPLDEIAQGAALLVLEETKKC